MRYLLIISLFLSSISHTQVNANELIKPCIQPVKQQSSSYYKGTIGDKLNIELFIDVTVNNCDGSNIYQMMYRYENQKDWIYLHTYSSQNDSVFHLIEDKSTGFFFLKKNNNQFTGKWISPDATKQIDVKLSKQAISRDRSEELSKTYENLLMLLFDC